MNRQYPSVINHDWLRRSPGADRGKQWVNNKHAHWPMPKKTKFAGTNPNSNLLVSSLRHWNVNQLLISIKAFFVFRPPLTGMKLWSGTSWTLPRDSKTKQPANIRWLYRSMMKYVTCKVVPTCGYILHWSTPMGYHPGGVTCVVPGDTDDLRNSHAAQQLQSSKSFLASAPWVTATGLLLLLDLKLVT